MSALSSNFGENHCKIPSKRLFENALPPSFSGVGGGPGWYTDTHSHTDRWAHFWPGFALEHASCRF
ncbi:hypothetical protein [Andreprevotia lacus]|jgi:hypothetical protein|uniref:hypothetical protein n=1 Tax=Andreprevotia lacus TaxID=1121000 RepID=UPI00111C5214|nr:hypothetical protein [Andreprevotia lacus]